MYIIEKIIKLYLKFKKKDIKYIPPENEDMYKIEDVLTLCP